MSHCRVKLEVQDNKKLDSCFFSGPFLYQPFSANLLFADQNFPLPSQSAYTGAKSVKTSFSISVKNGFTNRERPSRWPGGRLPEG